MTPRILARAARQGVLGHTPTSATPKRRLAPFQTAPRGIADDGRQ
jgi:hypothetical protein